MKKTLLFILAVLFTANLTVMANEVEVDTCHVQVVLHNGNFYNGWESNTLNVTYVNELDNTVTAPLTIDYNTTDGNIYSEVFAMKNGCQIQIALDGTGSTTTIRRTFELIFPLTGKVLYRSPSLYENFTKTINLNCADKYKNYVTVYVEANVEGYGTFSGDYGDRPAPTPTSGTITATPAAGHLFENWKYDGEMQATTYSLAYTDLEFDCKYVANFIPIEGVYMGDFGENSNANLPIYSSKRHSLSQQIYTAADGLHSGEISSISIYNDGTERTRTLRIYMSQVADKDEFSSTTDWVAVTDADIVYDASTKLNYGKWTTIALSTPFVLEEDNNLCITIHDRTNSVQAGVKGRVNAATTKNQSLNINGNTLNVASLGTGALSNVKNQIILNYNAPAPDTYTITATAQKEDGTDGGGTITGAGEYELNETCTLTAIADANYRFLAWYDETGDIVSFDKEISFNVEEDRDLVAKFYTYHWTSDITGNEGNMTMTGVFEIDGIEQGDADHVRCMELAAFIDDTCRCTRFVNDTPGLAHYKYFMSVLGSSYHNGKTVHFRVYDHLNSEEPNYVSACDIPYNMTYSNNKYHFNFLSMFTVHAVTDPVGAGMINGVAEYLEEYQYMAHASLTATANNGYAFRCWKKDGDVVCTTPDYSFDVIENVELVVEYDNVFVTPLQIGWTWWSTPIEISEIDGLAMLKNSLGTDDNECMIKSQTQYTYYDEDLNDWDGDLESINNESCYMIYRSVSGNATMIGQFADPSEHPITIGGTGFAWIGYPVSVEQDVTAIASFAAVPDEIVKSQSNYAYFDEDYGVWEDDGEFMFTPGLGYQYKSLVNDSRQLTFAVSGSKGNNTRVIKEKYWNSDYHAFKNNMNILAVVNVEDMEMADDNLEVGAFVNGECRGTIRLKYVERRNRYYAMLTVAGNDGDVVEFGLVDAQNNRMSTESKNVVTFTTNAVIGSFKEPFEINLGAMEAISRSDLNIFPNPVDKNATVTLNLPVDETIREIVVTNTLGSVVADMKTSLNVMENGMPVAGIYLVKVVCNSGNVYIGKLIVR